MDRKRMSDIAKRIARIDDGPVGKILDKYWNRMHDMEAELESAKRDYGYATSYPNEGEDDAEYMMNEIDEVLGAISEITTKKFSHLLEKESMFIKKWNTPESYVKERRTKMFPK